MPEDGDESLSNAKDVGLDFNSRRWSVDALAASSVGTRRWSVDAVAEFGSRISYHIRSKASALVPGKSGDSNSTVAVPHFLRFFRDPRQQKRWGEPEHKPHVDWADLFFDLIYVANAYQLGSLLMRSVSAEGVLWFYVMFSSLSTTWYYKLAYDCRLVTDDLAHKIVDVVEAMVVAAASLHIGSSVSDMKDLSTGHAMGFSAAVALHRALHAFRWWEVAKVAETHESAAMGHKLTRWRLVEMLIYAAAAVCSSESNRTWLGDSGAIYALACWCLASQRRLVFVMWSAVRGCSRWTPCAASTEYCARFTVHADSTAATPVIDIALPKKQRLRTVIPMHCGYSLHRFGEWSMLMIGESVLSLIAGVPLDNTSFDFYLSFFCGFAEAASLQFIHFATQPSEPEAHAIKRSASGGILWVQLLWIQSAAFVSFGVSLKLMLKYANKSHLPAAYMWLLFGSLAALYLLTQFMKACHKGTHSFVAELGMERLAPCLGLSTKRIAEERDALFADDASSRVRALLTLAKIATVVLALLLPAILDGRSAVWAATASFAVALALVVLEATSRSTAVLSAKGNRKASAAIQRWRRAMVVASSASAFASAAASASKSASVLANHVGDEGTQDDEADTQEIVAAKRLERAVSVRVLQ